MFKEILQFKWLTAMALAIIGFFLVSIIRLEPTLLTVRKELKNLDQKIGAAKKTSLELEKLGDYLKSNAYLERQARLKLNYKKPDEKVVFVYQKSTEASLLRQTGLRMGLAQKIFENKLIKNLKFWLRYLIEK